MNVQITLSIPKPLYGLAQFDAWRQSRNVEEILIESLQSVYGTSVDHEYLALLEQARAFQEQHSQLISDYEGEYVAIYDGEVIDHDSDRIELSDRIYASQPSQTVLIRYVTTRPERVLNMRSPRISHNT